MPGAAKSEMASLSRKPDAEVGFDPSVPILPPSSTGRAVSDQRNSSSRRVSINLTIVPSSIPERSENEEEEERLEAELDEMARYIGPVAKSLFTPVVAPLVDANSFADALGVSPLYKQKESQRWNTALHTYRQMSTSDQNGQSGRKSEDEEPQGHTPPSNDAIVGDFDENLMQGQSAPPISIPTHNNRQSNRQQSNLASSAKNMLSPPTGSSSFPIRMGFMTPPASVMAAASYVVSPPRRMSSSVSPGEASLNSLELEAIAAVHELQFAVKDIYVSEMLPRTSELIFLNVTTLEGQAYCVELTLKGWRVTSLRHDCMNGDIHHLDLHIQYFETIYALMDRISPDYRRRFTDALMSKLTAIQAERSDDASTTSDVIKTNDECDRLELEQRQTFT